MSIVKIDILNHADYHANYREDFNFPGISKFYNAIESVRYLFVGKPENEPATYALRVRCSTD